MKRNSHLRKRTFALVVCFGIFLMIVTVTGFLLGERAITTDFSRKNMLPGIPYIFGTDWMGRDMFARTLRGLASSIFIGMLASGVSALIALVLGTAAATLGRRADAAITWLIDLMMGVPHIVLLILISYAVGKGFWGVMVGVAVTHWPSLCRILRGEILQIKEAPYIGIARRLGKSPWYIAKKHIFPQVLPQFLVGLVLLFPHAILHEASITFLGFGLPPEKPAIGIILSESMSYLGTGKWWLALFPGLALVVVVVLFSQIGNGLRTLLDPASAHI
ncbi:MAG: ABC transporter permease [Roseburia sp.]